MAVPLLLVTNDDGVHAPGLRALAAGLAVLGEVHVVAPDRERSACGQSLTISRPLRPELVEPSVYAVDGTPADCVNMAVVRLLGRRPDLVLSGINSGPNLGEDIFYSGTVGGAREASFFGIPAIAVSLATRATGDFSAAVSFAVRLAGLVLERRLPERTLLNVNVPAGKPTRALVTSQGRREHEALLFDGFEAESAPAHWDAVGRERWEGETISDIEAVRQGLVSITPLQTDTTHHAALGAFRTWEQLLVATPPDSV